MGRKFKHRRKCIFAAVSTSVLIFIYHATFMPQTNIPNPVTEDSNLKIDDHKHFRLFEVSLVNDTNNANQTMRQVNYVTNSSMNIVTNGNKSHNLGNQSDNEQTIKRRVMPENFTDDFNEFDITDLDDHVTIPSRRRKKTRDRQQQGETVPHEEIQQLRTQLKWNGDYSISLNNSVEYRKQIYNAFYRPVINKGGVQCEEIIDNNDKALIKAMQVMRDVPRKGISTEKYARTVDCENFRGGRGYIEHPLSQKELDFPLAFTISVYTDLELAERLLRAIYRPHNYYCMHLDTKMTPVERTAFENIAHCLDNVFISETSLNVTWGQFSVLEMELVCMKQLWRYKNWKYYINLTGQEFPLKTNREIVAILDAVQGANLVDGTWIRAKQKYFYRWTQAGNPPPHRIRPIKGSVHVALNRNFVDFALHDERSRDFLEWLKKTQIPDETFFSSLNHNPHLGINGSFLGEAEEYPLKPSLMRYKNWEIGHSVFVRSCSGKYVRHICVLGVGDLHRAYNDIGLFANKFNLDFEYLALDCLEEVLHKKTWDQYLNGIEIDTTYFKHLDYVSKKLFVPP